jgi:hypothetical protein
MPRHTLIIGTTIVSFWFVGARRNAEGSALEARSEFMASEGNACACDLITAHAAASSTNGQALPDASLNAAQ